jgi:zinc protease
MRGALVRDSDLESERTVVLNELEMGENEPFELLMRGAFAQAYLEHPYRHPTIGWRGDVEAVTGDVLRRFYDTYYHPGNAAALVVGDIDEAAPCARSSAASGPAAGPAAFPPRDHRERAAASGASRSGAGEPATWC